MRKVFLFSSLVTSFLIFGQHSYSQALYSYVDENGTKVFTNIAPTSPPSDLKIIGANATPNPATPPAGLKSEAYNPIIEKYASNYRLDPSLIRSIIAAESGFNPKAVSSKGARGLMQLMPETAKRLGVINSFDPEQNIQGGIKHFRFLMDSFNEDIPLSLAAYNAGENLIQRLGRIPDIRETKDYVQSVTKRYDKNKSETKQAPQTTEIVPVLYRYLDDSGVLHVTNIPPLR
jgi:hypothetical protein